MFITDEKHHNTQFLANLSCDEKSIRIPLPNKICNSAVIAIYLMSPWSYITGKVGWIFTTYKVKILFMGFLAACTKPKWPRQVSGQFAVPQLGSSLGSMVKKSKISSWTKDPTDVIFAIIVLPKAVSFISMVHKHIFPHQIENANLKKNWCEETLTVYQTFFKREK